MAIPQSVIDSIHQQIDIVDVIGEFVKLKKKGVNYWACCPFHGEKTPSFAVNPAKNIFKCFGCGKSGNAITFVMEHEKLSYPDTIRFLAKKYRIEFEEEKTTLGDSILQNERESLYIILNFAKNYFQQVLWQHSEGQSIGMSYFKERGFEANTLKKFELGYSLNEWDAFLKEAQKNNFNTDTLIKAGLVLSRENTNDTKEKKYYDRFRGRVIFPIHNVTGNVIAFGARILTNDKNQPKYVNSPETEVYHKSHIVYGIYQAKNEIRARNNCYLVEGYTDVLSMHQAGVQNVVASSGTSLTIEQIKLIKRYTQNITVLYDGDSAGVKASLRGIDLILEEGLNVSVVLLPDNDDPDSFIRKRGPEAFAQYILKNSKDFITFKTSVYLSEMGNDPLKKALIIKEIVSSISKIPDAIKRALFFKVCSSMLDIDEQILLSEYNKIIFQKRTNKKNTQDKHLPVTTELGTDEVTTDAQQDIQVVENNIEAHEKTLLRMLINYASEKIDEEVRVCDYILSETNDIETTNELFAKIIREVKKELAQGNEITKAFFLEHPDDEIKKFAQDSLIERYHLSEHWQKFGIFVPNEIELLSQNTPRSILRYKRLIVRLMMEDIQKELSSLDNSPLQDEILTKYLHLQSISKEINRMLGIVIG